MFHTKVIEFYVAHYTTEETFKIFYIYIFRILIIKILEESVINLTNSIHVLIIKFLNN